ncbi:MAG: winged helix-turn-helix domain-containing protein [Candidatus Freyarchaeum deiterrae]
MQEKETSSNESILLTNKSRREILLILGKGGDFPSEIARKLSKHKSTIIFHLEKLKNAGLIRELPAEQTDSGYKKIFEITESGKKQLEKLTFK